MWGFGWEYSGIPFEDKETPPEVTETVDYLDMWDYLETSFEKLSPEDKARVKKDPLLGEVQFPGFDANNEKHYGIARYLIRNLGRFEKYKDHYLNSHSQQVERYGRMYKAFEPMLRDLHGQPLNAEQIVAIMNAGLHPSHR